MSDDPLTEEMPPHNPIRWQICGNCQFSWLRKEKEKDKYWYECHAYAPRAGQSYPSWPTIKKDDWCGEWEPRE